MVSVCGVVVATIALVCVLSVYNGFSDIFSALFSSLDPELKVTPRSGKVFDPNTSEMQAVKKLAGVDMFCEVVEGQALVRSGNRQAFAVIKGVDDTFKELTQIDSVLLDGSFILHDEVTNYATIGVGLSSSLGARPNFSTPIELYVPKRDERVNMANPATSFNQEYLFVGGVFRVNQPSYDDSYMIVPLSLARTLFHYDKEVTAIELGLSPDADISSIKSRIKAILGDKYVVKDRFEQQEASYKMLQVEKWMTFLILCFILAIALFNVVGSLSMLMIEKRGDVHTLRNMGADDRLIRRIFLFEGWMISGFGALIGVVIGLVLCLLQQELGLIKLGQTAGAFIVDAYPVRVEAIDMLMVLSTVGVIGFFSAWYPVHYLGKKWLKGK